jgi:hypothetical protein
MVKPPVTSKPELLPLNDPNWSWDQFEAFCLELISKFAEVKSCHRYGRKGDFQKGIDVFVDRENGERWVFQCKRYQKFNEKQTQTAIQTATYPANHYILLLSCEASSKVRDEIDKHSNWDIWDVQDISLQVRNLLLDTARRLVETHFGTAWRRAFLGLPGLITFVSSEIFFAPLLNPENPSNHLIALIGRKNILQELNNFIDSKERVLIFTGRGGIGKTKILHAFSQEFEQRHQNFELRFLAGETEINSENLDELPAKPCVVIVDDAHRREDLSTLFTFARQKSHIKLILSSRPQGMDYLKALITRANFNPREVNYKLSEIKELAYEDIKELAAQALGHEYAHYAHKLAVITKDCPLITVVAGRLLADRKVDPLLLERDEEFRDFVLTKFQDELVGKISDKINSEDCESLLSLIAAIAPFKIEPNFLGNNEFIKAAAEFLGLEIDKFITYVGILEEKGILLKRGYSLRIIPDVLADHILHKACITATGIPTGYAQKIFKKFKSICLNEVLQNLSELDWRIRQAEGKETDLLTDIWQSIQLEFENASNYDRGTLLDNLNKVAYYQPRRTLKLVEFAMRNPAKIQKNDKLADFYNDTWVRYKLPDLLQKISYTIDYLARCCDLLWELGRNDSRDINTNSRHAIRILKDLAKYDPEKPIEFYQNLVNTVSQWLTLPDVNDHVNSPLDILEPLLKKSGKTTYIELNHIVSRPFILNRQGTKIIRKNVLNIVEECAKNHRLKSAIRAINLLGTALNNPEPYFNMEITAAQKEQWIPEQLHILDFLTQLVQERSEPLLHLEIIRVVKQHIHYAYSERVRNKALEVINLIPNTYELRLIGVLAYTQDLDWLINNRVNIDLIDFEVDNYIDKRQKEIYISVGEEFLKQHKEADEVVQIINEQIKAIQEVNTNFYPFSFFDTLTEIVEQDFILKMCEAIIQEPQEPLGNYFGYFLNKVRQININKALEFAKFALNANLYNINISLADKCWFWTHNLQPDDVLIIKSLLNHNDINITNSVLHSLKSISNKRPLYYPYIVTKIALDIEVGSSPELAGNLCSLFDITYGIPPATLKDKEIATILEKLEKVENIDTDDISKFLAYSARRIPRSVIQLFLRRIERDQQGTDSNYQPLPFEGFRHNLNGLNKSDEYEEILRDILQESLKMTYSTDFWFPKLFREVSLEFNPISLNILEEWINSKEADKIQTASCLLSNAPKQFVFTHLTFVKNLLEQAYDIGDECYQQVSYYLRQSVTSGIRTGLSGQPYREDILLKEQASAIIAQLIVGSPSYKFYSSLIEWAKSKIKSKQILDEEV